jgi:hypothetical protein
MHGLSIKDLLFFLVMMRAVGQLAFALQLCQTRDCF